MSGSLDWLPPLILLMDYGGDWHEYVEALYEQFRNDFVDRDRPRVDGRRLGLKRHPIESGKERTFWHFIQEGDVEDERTPDFRRCERIGWIRPMIEAFATDRIIWWMEHRGNSSRILISLPDFSYVVVLDDRGDYVLPWTAYYVEHEHRRRKLARGYERYWCSRNG